MVKKSYCEGCEHYKQHTPAVSKCHAKSKNGRMLYNIDRCPKLPPKPKRRRKDLVDVVRCKDCIYRIRRDDDVWCLVMARVLIGDGYCAWGERKDA